MKIGHYVDIQNTSCVKFELEVLSYPADKKEKYIVSADDFDS